MLLLAGCFPYNRQEQTAIDCRNVSEEKKHVINRYLLFIQGLPPPFQLLVISRFLTHSNKKKTNQLKIGFGWSQWVDLVIGINVGGVKAQID